MVGDDKILADPFSDNSGEILKITSDLKNINQATEKSGQPRKSRRKIVNPKKSGQ